MTDAAATTLILLVWTFLVAAVAYLSGGRRGRESAAETDEGSPVVRELTDEVRKWRAEAEHWRRTAQRLQRELDGRG